MSILIKYLSLEAIENTVTCLNYKIDKVIFFGRKNIIEEERYNISSFLFKYLNCESEFLTIDNKSFEELEEQLKQYCKDNVYFDLTGDEGIFEGAVFKVANDLDVPTHTFDIWNKNVVVIKKDKNGRSIEDIKKEKPFKLNIKTYIEMIGGFVVMNDTHRGDVNPYMIQLRKEMGREKWVTFCSLLSYCKVKEASFFSCINLSSLINMHHYKISENYVLSIIKDLDKNNIINISNISENRFSFYCDENLWLLTKAGNILEQIVYLDEKEKSDDCEVGLCFSWDIEKYENDTRNEIDVVSLNDYQLKFISCKDRKIERDHIYELEAVGRGFAGNYINMELITTDRPTNDLIERGKELGIKIKYLELNAGNQSRR